MSAQPSPSPMRKIWSFGRLSDAGGDDDTPNSSVRSSAGRQGAAKFLPMPETAGVVALDFDGTLAVRGVAFTDMSKGVVDHCFGGSERVAQLTAWLEGLRADGATLAVVSRNSQRILNTCLGELGWAPLFGERVFGREDIEKHSMLHGRKSVLIRKLLVEPFGLRAEDVMLVDDEDDNCDDLRKRLAGSATVFVRGRSGMVPEEMAEVSAWMRGRVQAAASGHMAQPGSSGVLLSEQTLVAGGFGTPRHSTATDTGAASMRKSFTSLGLSAMAGARAGA